jgi:hypothetical protein
MALPGYAADASLYRTSQPYRGTRSEPVGDAGTTVVAQQITFTCRDSCVASALLCGLGCAWATGPFAWVCPLLCVGGLALCLGRCPPDIVGGGGGVPQCCPPGRTCRCGGQCVTNPNGTISCVDGLCLTPNQQCP